MTSSDRPDPALRDASASPDAVVEGPGFRITVLTSRLLRLEHQPDGVFTDAATQLVLDRRFAEVPWFRVERDDEHLELWTEHLHLRYDQRPFSDSGLSITMRQRAQATHRTTWRYGDPPNTVREGVGHGDNLGGTARTLDDVDGATELEPGLLSRTGYAVVDDSASLLMTDDDWVVPRAAPGRDLYFFGYGRDHAAALADWFALTGPSPLLPRWTLGNWWSRYHRYDAEEYLALVDRFTEAGIPFSVAVLDMDWHLVDIDPELGSGWTGYTWDTDLFPDPAGFLAALHDRGLRVTLNVHPADGVRRHEEAYAAVARDLGLDPDAGLEIAFDVTSRDFVRSYLTRLHHPHEEIGVDFWWLDWQSGSATRVPGLDPLWMLNHLHYLDSGRDGARPLTFSRYAGLGSHRYPVGFSGDTVTTWHSLAFQPYFTATAANVGYHWWSHDIGGHLGGAKDDELAARWFQLGVFSPVMRLHSSSSPFNSKEPWRFGPEAERVMARFLRLRHQLVPYLYTAMWASHTDGVAPVRPLYHDHPDDPEAYEVPHQFLFGADLLVAPVTSPTDRATGHAAVTAWLPEGTWYDVADGRRYDGGRTLTLHRTLDEIPVLAPAGAVLPLAADPTAPADAGPEALLVRVFAGADGGYTLLEDDGSAAPQERTEIRFDLRWTDRGDGTADAALDVTHVGPDAGATRAVRVELVGVDDDSVRDLGRVDLRNGARVEWTGLRPVANDVRRRSFEVLDAAQVRYDLKERAMALVERHEGAALLAGLATLDLPGNLRGVLTEIVAAHS